MRTYLTGGSGLVGSNVARVFAERHGATVLAPGHHAHDGAPTASPVDVSDRAAVMESVHAFGPDVIVHCAILNDHARLRADRRTAWEVYVGATRHLVDAANQVGAKMILVSTDWVFDGEQSHADERTPPNPVNLYGVLKMASEMVVTERARDGAVARLAGVNGVHWARPFMPPSQNAGFGNLVACIVESLSAGNPFTVWESTEINMVATPSLASDCAEMMWRIADHDLRGVFHCCGGEAVSRRRLADLTVEAFDLDPSPLRLGLPDPAWLSVGRVPYDTSLDAAATAVAIEMEPLSAREVVRRYRRQRDTGMLDDGG